MSTPTTKPVASPQEKANKIVEKNLNEYITRYIYAAFEDIKATWNGDVKYSNKLHQNYHNLIREKEQQSNGLANRFTIADGAKQFLRVLFEKLLCEIHNTELGADDSIEVIKNKVAEANYECYTAFMFDVHSLYKERFEATLKGAVTTNWISTRMDEALPKHKTKKVVMVYVVEKFEGFLKALGWLLATRHWYEEGSLNEKVFLATFAQLGMSQIMIDVVSSALREKPPVKPKAKKGTAGSTAEASETSETPIDSNGTGTVEVSEEVPEGTDAVSEFIGTL